jgi:hypothetical protein
MQTKEGERKKEKGGEKNLQRKGAEKASFFVN